MREREGANECVCEREREHSRKADLMYSNYIKYIFGWAACAGASEKRKVKIAELKIIMNFGRAHSEQLCRGGGAPGNVRRTTDSSRTRHREIN